MTQKSPPQKHNQELTPEIIADFIEIQKQKALNEAKELQLREKELELSAKHAEKALEYQAQYLSKQPTENRKTITRIGWIFGLLVTTILGVLTCWIWMGKEDFAYKFLQGVSYVLTTALGYWLGSKNKKKQEDDKSRDINDAEVVQ